MTLGEAAPREFHIEYRDTKAYTMKDVQVVSMHESDVDRWPGPQKNVFRWWKLANGRSVGWNENPARGWSFPVV